MSIKKQFIEKVKLAFPNFNPDTDKVIISYNGSNDSFDSFSDAIVKTKDGKRISGDWVCDNDADFLFQIIERSKVYYSWVDAKMSGTIKYANRRLWVENTQCEKIIGYDGYTDDDSYGYDNDVFDYDNSEEWNCIEERGAVFDADEELYDVYDLNEDGFDSYDMVEKTHTAKIIPITIHVDTEPKMVVSKPKKVKKKPLKKVKSTQSRNGKKVTKAKKKVTKAKVKAKPKKTVKKKAVKKKK